MSRWIMGVDPAQRIDYTGIVLIEVTTRGDARNLWYSVEDGAQGEDWIRPLPEWFTNHGLIDGNRICRVDVRWMHRFREIPYPDAAAFVKSRLERFTGRKPDCVVDTTGVGRGFLDSARQLRLRPVPVSITAGQGESFHADRLGSEYHVSKTRLVTSVDIALNDGTLRIAPTLPLAPVLQRELQEFRAQFNSTGYAQYGAPSGEHDDLVLALSLALWWANYGRSREVSRHTVLI